MNNVMFYFHESRQILSKNGSKMLLRIAKSQSQIGPMPHNTLKSSANMYKLDLLAEFSAKNAISFHFEAITSFLRRNHTFSPAVP